MSVSAIAYKVTPMELSPLREEPRVTVMIANYNYGRFLPAAVDSVINQTYTKWELIICDDGSTDDSHRVLSCLESLDERIKVLRKENGGQASAWNAAYRSSSGEIICFLDADDLMMPAKLQKVVCAFRSDCKVGYVYHQYSLADENGNPLGPLYPGQMPSGDLSIVALNGGGYAMDTNALITCLRREVADELFPLPNALGQFGDRYIGNLSAFLTEIAAVTDCLAYYRIHGANHSGAIGLHPSALRIVIEATDLVFPHQKQFLVQRFGTQMAHQVRVEDTRAYWEHLAAVYLLTNGVSEFVDGYSRSEIRSNLRRSNRYHAWRLLFALPNPVSQGLLRLWWGNSSWKPYARPLTRLLRLG